MSDVKGRRSEIVGRARRLRNPKSAIGGIAVKTGELMKN